MKWVLFLTITTLFIHTAKAASHKNAIEGLRPGESTTAEVKSLLGKPLQTFSERGAHEYLFFDLGDGPSSLATVSLKSGVVEYYNFLCEEKISDVLKRYDGVASQTKEITSEVMGRKGKLKQLFFDSIGKGFVYEPHTKKIKACMVYQKGKSLEE